MVRRQGDDKFLTNRLSLPFFMLVAFSVAGHALTARLRCGDVESRAKGYYLSVPRFAMFSWPLALFRQSL